MSTVYRRSHTGDVRMSTAAAIEFVVSFIALFVTGPIAFISGIAAGAPDGSLQCQTATIFGLKTADCHGLGLEELPKRLDRDVKVLKFGENRLSELDVDQFLNYPTVQEIYLVRNRITTIAAGAFRGLLSLQKLDLEANQINVIRYDFLSDIRSVRVLNFRYNPIISVEPGAFANLANLEEINLERCRITSLNARTFEGLDRLLEINIADNDLAVLPAEMERHLPTGLRVFRFYRNPWQCDCHLRWLRVWTTSRSDPIMGIGGGGRVNWDFARNTPTCSGPRLLRGVSWKLLDADQFACPAQIVVNSTTSIQVGYGMNTTIECVVLGDPVPSVTWYKDSLPVDGHVTDVQREQATKADSVITRSFLYLHDVRPAHTGDYRCVAHNSAGRSEVTFKVWMDRPGSAAAGDRIYGQRTKSVAAAGQLNVDDNGSQQDSGVSVELIVGSVIGSSLVVVLVIGLAVTVFLLRRRCYRQQHSYHVRDYQPSPTHQASNNNKIKSLTLRMSSTNNKVSATSGGSLSSMRRARKKKIGSTAGNNSATGNSMLSCLRKPSESGSASIKDEEDEKELSDTGLREDEEEVDKFVSTTLQSLLESKSSSGCDDGQPLSDRSAPAVERQHQQSITHSGDSVDVDNLRQVKPEIEMQSAVTADTCRPVNEDGYKSAADIYSCSTTFNNGTTTIEGSTDNKFDEGIDMVDRCDDVSSSDNQAASDAPDLLRDGSDQLVLIQGGPTRSPYRRMRSAHSTNSGTKVSFAIDLDYCIPDMPLVTSAVTASRSSSMSGISSIALHHSVDENQCVAGAPNDGKDETAMTSFSGYRTSIPGESWRQNTIGGNHIPQAAGGAVGTPESSSSGCSGYCVVRSGSLGRRSRLPSPAVANHVTLPTGRFYTYSLTGSSRNSSAVPRLPDPSTSYSMALPSTIVGVTEGLFIPEKSHVKSASITSSTLPRIPPAPMKPLRTYEWRTAAGNGGSGYDAMSSSSVSSTANTPNAITPAIMNAGGGSKHAKKVKLRTPEPSAMRPRQDSLGTAV